MKDGYLIKLIDGTEIAAIPNDGGKFSFDIGETSVIIENGAVSISGDASVSAFNSEIIEIIAKKVDAPDPSITTSKPITETKDNVGILRRCIVCGPRRYCITNGCANTPCGWICDR
tara:strand:+ start:671 stop:1018 length:348 start_codon:yes stop_codon:yes gene_type:complete